MKPKAQHLRDIYYWSLHRLLTLWGKLNCKYICGIVALNWSFLEVIMSIILLQIGYFFFQVNPEITISIWYIDKRWLVKQKCHLCIMHTILIYMSKISFLKINQCLCILWTMMNPMENWIFLYMLISWFYSLHFIYRTSEMMFINPGPVYLFKVFTSTICGEVQLDFKSVMTMFTSYDPQGCQKKSVMLLVSLKFILYILIWYI